MAEDRSERIRAWLGSDEGFSDQHEWEGLIWWGYFWPLEGEEVRPPVALFPTEEEANAYGERMSREDPDGPRHEWHVGPCNLTIQTRDNIDVPE